MTRSDNLIKRVSRQYFGSYDLSYRKLCKGIWYVTGSRAKGFIVDTNIWKQVFDNYKRKVYLHGTEGKSVSAEQHYAIFDTELQRCFVYWMCYSYIWKKYAKIMCHETASEDVLQNYAKTYLLLAKRAFMLMEPEILREYPAPDCAEKYL